MGIIHTKWEILVHWTNSMNLKNLKNAWAIIFVATFSCCSTQPQPQPRSQPQPQLCQKGRVGDAKKPADFFSFTAQEPRVNAYARFLIEKNEPSLAMTKHEVYRLSVLPSRWSPTIIRIEHTDQNLTAYITWGGGPTNRNYPPTHNPRCVSVNISALHWDAIQACTATKYFRNMETIESNYPAIIADGSTWVLEGKNQHFHHIVLRRSPEFDSKERDLDLFLQCGLKVLEAVNLSIDEVMNIKPHFM